MPTSLQEKLKADLNTAKTEGKQRVDRISDILKAAASMTIEEIKAGSSEIHVLTRKSVAELLAELNLVGASADTLDGVAEDALHGETSGDIPPPAWSTLLSRTVAGIRDRQGDWWEQLKSHLAADFGLFDADMTESYGDRYLWLKTKVQTVAAWMRGTEPHPDQQPSDKDVQPITIEVLDDQDDPQDL